MRVLVKDVMTRNVIKLQKDWTIKAAAEIFLERIIDGAPVVDEKGKVIGVFTKTHLLRNLGKSLETRIETLMSRNVISINENMQAEEALSIPVGRLPVVNDAGIMVGWLTRTDLAQAFIDKYQESMQTMEDIIESMHNPVVFLDVKGHISLFNWAAQKLWKLDREDVLGKHADQVFADCRVLEVLRKQRPLIGVAVKINGLLYSANISPVFRQGKISGAIGVFEVK